MALCPHGYTLNWDCPFCNEDAEQREGMSTVSVSKATWDLLHAFAESKGWMMSRPRTTPAGLVEFELDEEVLAHLRFIDPDVDAALRVVLTTGVGHA